ncbi:hypothetical protein O181_107426 [Austropuccinia psidii MF-1]|uniref:Uncharacterized protein n=1 Tax=Austropuccinia psidii MF-1 TaxID=1389203 RepID=A0A9Q3PP40_9BASI|nr:hypothetical protein [Austropuccinia psidii MF-1]
MYNIEVISSIQAFQHEFRNSQRCSNSKSNEVEQILNTLPRISTPLNQNEGTGIPNPQVLDSENSQLKNEFSTSFHNLEPSMGQALLEEVPKLKSGLTSVVKENMTIWNSSGVFTSLEKIVNYQKDW